MGALRYHTLHVLPRLRCPRYTAGAPAWRHEQPACRSPPAAKPLAGDDCWTCFMAPPHIAALNAKGARLRASICCRTDARTSATSLAAASGGKINVVVCIPSRDNIAAVSHAWRRALGRRHRKTPRTPLRRASIGRHSIAAASGQEGIIRSSPHTRASYRVAGERATSCPTTDQTAGKARAGRLREGI